MTTRTTSAAAVLLTLVAPATTCWAAAALRVGNWNVGNQPNDAAQAANVRTVLDHADTLGTNARPLDVLALAETDGSNFQDPAAILTSLYGTVYASVVTPPDGGNDRTGLVYNASTVTLVDSAVVAGVTHPALRGHFRPAGTSGFADFYVYAVHLKSGDAAADEDARLAEAQDAGTW